MSFIRTKMVKGKEYAYLVENSWQKGTARQKVSKYLGKVEKPEKRAEQGLKEFLKIESVKEYVENSSFSTIIRDLAMLELKNHSLRSIRVNFEDFSITNEKEKNTVLQLNEGFMSKETVQELLNYNGEGDHSGFILADLMTRAGIKPEKDVFVELFEKKRPLQGKADIDFYY